MAKQKIECGIWGSIIYVMAPFAIYNHPSKYEAVITKLKEQFPGVSFILPHDAFKDNEDWRKRIDKVIKKADGGILLSDDGIIGYGCYYEMGKLHSLGKPVYYYDGETLADCFFINILPGDDWGRYAAVEVWGKKKKKRRMTS